MRGDCHRDGDIGDRIADDSHQDQGQHESGKRQHNVCEPHDHLIDPPTPIPGNQPDEETDDHGSQCHDRPDRHLEASGVDGPGKYIQAKLVGAKPVKRRGRLERGGGIGRDWVGDERGAKNGEENVKSQNSDAGRGERIPPDEGSSGKSGVELGWIEGGVIASRCWERLGHVASFHPVVSGGRSRRRAGR